MSTVSPIDLLFQISLADVTGPKIDSFLSTLNYKLVEQPWNFSEEVANSTSVCTHHRIRLYDVAQCTYPSSGSRRSQEERLLQKKFIAAYHEALKVHVFVPTL